MKNKNLIIAAVVVILILLLGAGGFLLLNKNNSNTTNNTASEQTTNNTDNKGQTTKSLLDLVKMGQNVRCTFKTTIANGSTDGTVYVSGQNVRGDFTVEVQGQESAQTSMIKNGDTTYIWGSTMPNKGIKMTVSLDEMSENKQASEYIDPNQKVDYNCTPWSVDSTLLTPPTNVEFTDMSSFIMPKTNESPTTQSNFNPCSSIVDETAKAACENALKESQ